MATEVKLPRLGQGMDEGKILTWLKHEGDQVDKGEEIYEVETEKVNVEVESPAKGTLLKIVVPEGGEVPIGTVIAWIGSKGEAVPETAAETPAAPAAAAPANDAPASAPQAAAPAAPAAAPAASPAPAPTSTNGRLKASPLARRIAHDRGLDLAAIVGSGPDGRVIARDLESAVAVPASAPAAQIASGDGVERVPLTSMRKTIARRLTEAWQAPAFFLTVEIDMTQVNALRARLVETMRDGDVKPTVSDIITKVCALALQRHPDVNVHFAGDAILHYAASHVGMAVATDAGLVVPVIRDAHAKTIREIAADRKTLVDKARSGKLQPADMEGGTFSISNLGMMGIDEFTAVLNPPQAAILAIGQTVDSVVVVDGEVAIRPRMRVTGSFDHRAVDGAVGAQFLQTVKLYLEDPLSML